ncbi:acetyltransferase [Salipiger sp. CCB-MM3]|uniref:CatB-related O-acetyltransferase n=1 Tax=Salipiger sp. CCB-MM3 TaxID=1792508 RepID=UPI00080AA2DE|nr:CatB-related O-acetyltransferase [Salipiger sp. CCB-MM3]ANT60748.1 acetyltransferase [Salipiger sp. CCB-MM3]
MPFALPSAEEVHPIILPDGTPHAGTVHLRAVIDHPCIEVGRFTYASDFDPPAVDGWAARLAPYLFPFSKDRLVIGNFCQIAHGVRFIGGSANHETRGLSTYPFMVFDREAIQATQPDARGIEIGHDVWLGTGAMVLAGAKIGSGAIIGAGAVVRGEVPPYAVVTGNPGRVAKMRFDPETIDLLLRLAWWHWPGERIAAARGALEAADITALEALAPG